MKLGNGIHLAYCTNIHRGESWPEIFEALKQHTLAVRDRVSRGKPYAIGLRLSNHASRQLSDATALLEFQRWLDRENGYVFTINGFPFGRFHGARVKEQVYAPDWTTNERVEYTNRLFELLSRIVPSGVEGSVSSPEQVKAMRDNVWRCVEHIARMSEKSGRQLHLGLEPEPLCFLETSGETVGFIEEMRADRPGDSRLDEHLGVNYDACHLAVEFEEPHEAIRRFTDHGIRISKLHFSSALKVRPTPEARAALKAFADDIYFHQVIARSADGTITRFKDLDLVLNPEPQIADSQSPIANNESAIGNRQSAVTNHKSEEWRIHFHVPLHSKPTALFDTTADHLGGVMDVLAANTRLCSHIEMETYTWEVLPPELKNRNVVDQLVAEYEWTLAELAKRGIH
jgi:sugar phosphate isomerase/epimerase